MSWDAMEWAHHVRIGLHPAEKLTLMALAWHAGRDGGGIYASIATLAAETELGDRTVQRAIAKLVEKGIVTATVGGGRRNTTLYALAIPTDWTAQRPKKGDVVTPIEPENPGVVTPFVEAKPRQDDTLYGKKGVICDKKGDVVTPKQQEEQQEKKGTSLRSVRTREPTATRLPMGWLPSRDDRAFASDLGLKPDVVAARFRDYWHGVGGARGRKVDWPATWRNWCRRDTDGPPAKAGSGRRETHEEERRRKLGIASIFDLDQPDPIDRNPVIDHDPADHHHHPPQRYLRLV